MVSAKAFDCSPDVALLVVLNDIRVAEVDSDKPLPEDQVRLMKLPGPWWLNGNGMSNGDVSFRPSIKICWQMKENT